MPTRYGAPSNATVGREISIWDDEDGISHVQGTLASPDAHALDRKLIGVGGHGVPA